MLQYKNVISLGFFCSVALEIERIGLREFSSPFDWLISDFTSVINLIDNNFEDFLEIGYLYQYKHNRAYYINKKYNLAFFHDFDEYKSLENQINQIQEKYQKRIDRFYQRIKEPTLFIRYIKNYDELKYIENNFDYIQKILKRFNLANDVLFVANNDIVSKEIKIYNVQSDLNDTVAREFIFKNNELKNFLMGNIYNLNSREANIKRYRNKMRQKNRLIIKIKHKLNKKFYNYCLKKYYHEKEIDLLN